MEFIVSKITRLRFPSYEVENGSVDYQSKNCQLSQDLSKSTIVRIVRS